MQITAVNGYMRLFGRFSSEKSAREWIAAHAPPEGTAQYRVELSEQLFPGFRTLVTKLDAIEGSQLLRAYNKSLLSPGRVRSRNDMRVY